MASILFQVHTEFWGTQNTGPSQELMSAQCDTAVSCYLLKSLHVLEVESNVEKAKVRIDEFKLQNNHRNETLQEVKLQLNQPR